MLSLGLSGLSGALWGFWCSLWGLSGALREAPGLCGGSLGLSGSLWGSLVLSGGSLWLWGALSGALWAPWGVQSDPQTAPGVVKLVGAILGAN